MKPPTSAHCSSLFPVQICLCPQDMNRFVSLLPPISFHTFAHYSSAHMPGAAKYQVGQCFLLRTRDRCPRLTCGCPYPTQRVMALGKTMLPHHKEIITMPNCLSCHPLSFADPSLMAWGQGVAGDLLGTWTRKLRLLSLEFHQSQPSHFVFCILLQAARRLRPFHILTLI